MCNQNFIFHATHEESHRSRAMKEACLNPSNFILLILSDSPGVEELANDFFGSVTSNPLHLPSLPGKTLYLCGDIASAEPLDLHASSRVFIIKELSCGYDDNAPPHPVVRLGRVPISVQGVGVLFREFFDPSVDHFNQISTDHDFQQLTESTKPNVAYRTGIYLSPVERREDETHFRLLRCSSNFSGPTANFSDTDRNIVGALNEEVQPFLPCLSCCISSPQHTKYYCLSN